jgi:hypothetical protein
MITDGVARIPRSPGIKAYRANKRERPGAHGRLERGMIDASDMRLLAWLAELPPRQELVVRMALNGRSKNQGHDWDARVSALMTELKINTTAKMAKLLREGREAGTAVEASAAAQSGIE